MCTSCYVHRCFLFSSRRRHTRFDCDWSSDVCSSDLVTKARVAGIPAFFSDGFTCSLAALIAAFPVVTTFTRTGKRGRPRKPRCEPHPDLDRKSTRLNSSHSQISYAVFCLKKKKT